MSVTTDRLAALCLKRYAQAFKRFTKNQGNINGFTAMCDMEEIALQYMQHSGKCAPDAAYDLRSVRLNISLGIDKD